MAQLDTACKHAIIQYLYIAYNAWICKTLCVRILLAIFVCRIFVIFSIILFAYYKIVVYCTLFRDGIFQISNLIMSHNYIKYLTFDITILLSYLINI